MKDHPALPPDQLRRVCDEKQFSFETTADLDDLQELIGQQRALEAAQFAIGMRCDGYNLYVMGPSGSGKHTMMHQLLKSGLTDEQPPPDWCYVHNFSQPHKPKAISFPAGLGRKFQRDMQQLIIELHATIPEIFEGEEYRHRINEINDEFTNRQSTAFSEVGEAASKRNVLLLRTPNGFSLAPAKNGEIIDPEAFSKLPEEEQARLEQDINALQEMLERAIHQVGHWRRERFAKVHKLNEESVLFAAGHLIDALREEYRAFDKVIAYLNEVQQHIIEHMDDFRRPKDEPSPAQLLLAEEGAVFDRFKVNLLVDHDDKAGVPVIDEEFPIYPNLFGRVDHLSHLGTLVTNFLQIKPGSLHLANGGYLLIDAYKLLSQPFAWEGLKRALYARAINIESLGQMYSLVSTVSLEPEPIPLNLKIVLFGDRRLYYLLAEYDPEFAELFKVVADFEDDIPHTGENAFLFARLVGTLARKYDLLPFNRSAVAAVIEHSGRSIADTEKLSSHIEGLADLLREANFQALRHRHQAVSRLDVEQAADRQIHRADRLRGVAHEEILRGVLHIDTEGEQVGQVNALSVFQLGQYAFAQPSRVTASTRLGNGTLVDIQREAKLGGPIHSKGVLILSSFLSSRYAAEQPLSLAASLVFEQTYGPVEGDSASLAELCALLSSLSGVPLRQSLAITGSVDQFGRAQAIGGANEKIEGFFDICQQRGLNGKQGVIIPQSNVAHLMLHRRVVDAVAAGRFHVYPVATVDDAMELLTGREAGQPDAQGAFAKGTINGLVAQKMRKFASIKRAFNDRDGSEKPRPEDQSHADAGTTRRRH
jgi:predicted ATP-dependent protease